MIRETEELRPAAPHTGHASDEIPLYPGITIAYRNLEADRISDCHTALDHILEIHYCRAGRMGWDMGNGNGVDLGPNDFFLHTLRTCADSTICLPEGHYEGVDIAIDLNVLTDSPPEPLRGTGITGQLLYQKFCSDASTTFLAGDERTERLFAGFFDQPEPLRHAYQKIKVIELLLYLCELKIDRRNRLSEYRSEQLETIRAVHRHLLEHMDQRITIEELSRQYLMNPTTLKALFKSVYGSSIAAHIKEHRMEEAARLLRETELSVAEIAGRTGYDSQSKFTTAFKTAFQILPKEYRKKFLV